MNFKNKLITMALSMMLLLSTIIAPKNIIYAASESKDDIKNKLIQRINEINTEDIGKTEQVKFNCQYIKEKIYSNQSSIKVDVTNPNNYQLVTDDFILLIDMYEQLHGLSYYDYSDIDKTYGELEFFYGCTEQYEKSDYIIMELYKEYNGKLTMQESSYWNLANTDEGLCGLEIDKNLYNQPYLYFKVAVADTLYGEYEDYQLFKIKNPFYNKNKLSDISGHWAENNIKDFISKGYVGGYTDGTFRPNNSITRAEFVKIVNKVFGLTKTSGKVFSDTKTHWAKTEIDIAVTNGVCNGMSATEFKPNEPITREQAAVMVANYKKIADTNLDKLNKYQDGNKVSSWAKSSVEGVIEKGYMGAGGIVFNPKNNITRAETVVTLGRIN